MNMSPRKLLVPVLGAACALLLTAMPAASEAPDPDSPEFATYVMNKIDDQYRGEKSRGIMQMKVKTKNWTRTMKFESWTLGTKYSLMRIISPKKEKGTATLKAKNDLFTYLSKTGKTIKITSGMMGGSWMGSHFTNDDLVKNSRMADDFTIKKTFSGPIKSGLEIHRFVLTPRKNAAVVWGKIVVSVRASDLQPLRQLYYDEDGNKVRVMKFYKHTTFGERTMPMKMVIKPLDGSGEYTQVLVKEMDFGVKLNKSFFSLQKLKSM
ncbi:MAG: outer membrane lipoprotein-sorting protein [Deltaproteobacteria bacterium]|nr:outer membrane lipoprotein-sorting protein [Deltaproteobacteria bacterium]